MEAFILADQDGAALGPLTAASPTALLHLAGVPLVERAVAEMAACGVKSALVAVSRSPERFRELLGDGTRWGMTLEFVLTRGDGEVFSLARAYRRRFGPEFLVARADILRSDASRSFVQLARKTPGKVVHALGPDGDCGLTLFRPEDFGETSIELQAHRAWPIYDFKTFHSASLALLAGRIAGAQVPGLAGPGDSRVGLNAALAPQAVAEGPVFVGRNGFVSKTSRLGPGVVVGDDAFVDDGTEVERSVIMPGTYVGRGLTIKDAIACGGEIIRVDISARVAVDEDSWISDQPSYEPWWSGPARLDQAAALVILAASLPLWPLAAALAHYASPSRPIHRRRLFGNLLKAGKRAAFDSVCFSGPIPALRNLPRLLDVACGHLRLIGRRPAALADDGPREDGLPAGLVSPGTLLGSTHRRLLEAELLPKGRIASLGFLVRRMLGAALPRFGSGSQVARWLPSRRFAE